MREIRHLDKLVESWRREQESPDALFALQLGVARKADELAHHPAAAPGLNRQCWLLAEAEVLGLGVTDPGTSKAAAPTRAHEPSRCRHHPQDGIRPGKGDVRKSNIISYSCLTFVQIGG